MAETPNRRLARPQGAGTTSPSTAEMKAAICETRVRLATRLARTADHIHVLLTVPSSAQSEARDGGIIGFTVHAFAIAGRTRRAWIDAKRTGVFRRAAVGAAAIAVAARFASKRKRS